LLCHIHRDVCTLHQIGRIAAMIGVDADADACRDRQDQTLQFERLVQGALDTLGNLIDGIAVGDARDEDCEFVATQPRDGVMAAQSALHAACKFLQQQIPVVMSEGVVDLLEAVEIHEHHGRERTVALGRLDRLLQPIVQ
jgi:hypothetical protein